MARPRRIFTDLLSIYALAYARAPLLTYSVLLFALVYSGLAKDASQLPVSGGRNLDKLEKNQYIIAQDTSEEKAL